MLLLLLLLLILLLNMRRKELSLQEQLAQKERALKEVSTRIYDLNDAITKTASTLKKKREDDKSARVSSIRIKAHLSDMSMEASRRPCDRAGAIRTYSKMDMDVWKFDDLRDWFNRYDDPNRPQEKVPSPSETGYMLRIK